MKAHDVLPARAYTTAVPRSLAVSTNDVQPPRSAFNFLNATTAPCPPHRKIPCGARVGQMGFSYTQVLFSWEVGESPFSMNSMARQRE